MNILRLIVAVLWTLFWGTDRWLRYESRHSEFKMGRREAFMWGRRESPKAMRCEDCGWIGPLRWAVHTYRNDGCGDVEGVDLCPRCNAEESIMPVLRPKERAWTS
jgi:hypothetical protein